MKRPVHKGISTAGVGDVIEWEGLLENLKERGVQPAALWIIEWDKAMLNAIGLKFSSAKRQRFVKNKMENVQGYIPENSRSWCGRNAIISRSMISCALHLIL